MKFNRELLKGHLQVILLAILDDGPCHAYALQKKLLDKSMGVFDLSEGTIYPTLHKIEKVGMIGSTWLERETGPKIRQYALTNKGKKVLEESKREWSYFSRAMTIILEKNKLE